MVTTDVPVSVTVCDPAFELLNVAVAVSTVFGAALGVNVKAVCAVGGDVATLPVQLFAESPKSEAFVPEKVTLAPVAGPFDTVALI